MIDNLVAALSDALIPPPLAAENRARIQAFIKQQWRAQMVWVRGGLILNCLLIDSWSRLRYLRGYLQLGPQQQQQLLATMQRLPLLEFLKTLTLLAQHAPDRPHSPPLLSLSPPWRTAVAEVIVVGSGPGGALCATLLAEAGYETLLLEEGEAYSTHQLPAYSALHLANRLRYGGLSIAIGKNLIPYIEGCALGGASEVNSGLYLRPDESILSGWQRDYQLDTSHLAEAMSRNEDLLHVVQFNGPLPPSSQRLADGADRLRWQWQQLKQWRHYTGQWQDTERASYHSVTTSLIPRFLQAGGRIETGRAARNIRQRDGHWQINGNGWCAHTPHLILGCGAIQTPALLRNSGIRHNIGNHIQMQVIMKVIAHFHEPINDKNMGMGIVQVREFAPQMSFGTAISTPAQLAVGLLSYPEQLAQLTANWHHYASYSIMLSARATGRVQQLSGQPQLFYSLTQDDWHQLALGLRRLCRLLLAAGATTLYPVMKPGRPIHQESDIEQLPDNLQHAGVQLQALHMGGGVPMGDNRSRCAVDNNGEIYHHPGLYVADASLMPTVPGANTQATVMALARRVSERFIKRHGQRQ